MSALNATEIFHRTAPAIANLIAVKSGQRIGSGSGFIVNGRLLTCAHVLRLPADCDLHVSFERPAEGATPAWTYRSTNIPIVGWSDEHSHDYAIIDVPADARLPVGLEWGESPLPGATVYGIGYPFDDPHLTIHQGIVSATMKSGPAEMLKLNMSINPSNSGGPLLDDRGRVVGIVARKATGLTKAFRELIASFDANIAVLAGCGGLSIGGIDPIEVSRIAQQQMRGIAVELERSANVGIGYAVWIEPLRHEQSLA